MEILGRFRVNVLFVVLVTFMVLSGLSGQVYAEGEGYTNQVITQESSDSFEFDSSTGTILKYNGAGGDVAIPDQIDGVAVKCIGNKAFWNNKSISRVVLPEGVEIIDTEAFSYCENLTEVVLPVSLLEIRDSAFEYANINNLVLPDNLTTVGSDAFAHNIGLAHVYISKSVSSLKSSAFIGCYSLIQIEVDPLSNDFCAVDNVLFSKDQTKLITYACGKTNESYQVPASVKTIDKGAFMFGKLKAISFSEGLETIGSNAFASSSIQEIRIPDSVTEIGYYAFYSSQLTAFFTSENSQINKIEYNCFDSCTNLTTVTLPKNLDKLETRLFLGCTNLKEIVIPESITAIDSEVFTGCSSLSKIQLSTKLKDLGSGAFSGCAFQTLELPYSIETMGNGVFADCKSLIQASLPGTLTKIPSYTFNNCSQLTYYQIPDQITEIGSFAFSGCTNLEKVDMNKNVQTIGERAFKDCIKLENIMIPKSVNSVENGTFHNCTQLKTIVLESADTIVKQEIPILWNTIPNTVTMIGHDPSTAKDFATTYGNTFQVIEDNDPVDGDSDFKYEIINGTIKITGYEGESTEVTIPSSINGVPVKIIGAESFRDKDSITKVTISEGIEEIGIGTFYSDDSLASVVLPESLKTIGNYAFENCMCLEEINIPKNVNQLFSKIINGMYCPFRDCRGLKRITVAEDNLTYKSINGVLYNKEMTELIRCPAGITDAVIIPEGIITIGDSAFAYCFNLPQVQLPNSLEKIGPYGFQNCNKLTTIQIPEKVKNIGEGAFFGCWLCTEFYLPPDLTKIEDQVFYDCRNLTQITMYNKVESIGNLAFAECEKMETFVVPLFIKSIGASAFSQCSSLSTLQFNSPDSVISTSYTLLNGSVINNASLAPVQTKIIGYEPSTARMYTAQFGNQFESMGSIAQVPETTENIISLSTSDAKDFFVFLGIDNRYDENSDLFKYVTGNFAGTYDQKQVLKCLLLLEFNFALQNNSNSMETEITELTNKLNKQIADSINDPFTSIGKDFINEALSSFIPGFDYYQLLKGQNSDLNSLLSYVNLAKRVVKMVTLGNDGYYLKTYISAKQQSNGEEWMFNVLMGAAPAVTRQNVNKLPAWGEYLWQTTKSLDKRIVDQLTVHCPVTLNILNSQGETVLSLSDDKPGVLINDIGEFSVVEDTVNGGYSKSALLYSNDYTFQIVGTGTGTMNLEYIDYSGDAPRTATTSGVSINKDMIIGISSDIQNINLSTDSNGDGQTDSNQALALEVVTPTDINLISSLIELEANSEGQIIAEVLPQLSSQNLQFQSQNSAVATVDLTGKIKAISIGETDIVVKIPGSEITKTCHVKVIQSTTPTGISLNASSKNLTVGESFQLEKTIQPEGLIGVTVNWESSDSNCVTVNENGLIKAKSTGSSTVSASIKQDGKTDIKASCVVTVSLPYNPGSGGGGGGVTPTPTPNIDVTKALGEIAGASGGSTVTVNVTNNEPVPVSILEATRGKDINIVFNYGSYTWTINGKSIQDLPAGAATYDLSIKTIQNTTLSNLANDPNAIQIEISHNGAFPFTGQLSYQMDASLNGQTVYRYYFNETDKKLEYQDQATVKDGVVHFDFEHASKYVISALLKPETASVNCTYQTQLENIGWQGYKSNGEVSGTVGESLRLEGIEIKTDDPTKLGVTYQTHVQNIGWQGFKKNGEMSGTAGESLRLEAIQIKLTGTEAEKYDVYYQVYTEKFGWLDWAKNGESAGSEGYSYRLEAIKIVIQEKGTQAPGSTDKSFEKNVQCLYQTHVQNVGWQGFRTNGDMSGTQGQALRLEGIEIKFDGQENLGVKYSTHVQNIGWQDFVKDGALSGTEGKSLRLEAIKIKLTGTDAEKYDIYYQVHAQNIGWLDWAKNGEESGTAGFGYRLEGIKIIVVPKGGAVPGDTARPFLESNV